MFRTPRSRTRSGRPPGVLSRSLRATAFACLTACPESATAASITWTGGAGNGLISSAGNWNPGVAPATGDQLYFAGNAGLNPLLSTALSVGQLAFNGGAGAFVLSGAGSYTIGVSGITNNSANLQTINNAITLGGSQTWTANTGGLVIGGAIN